MKRAILICFIAIMTMLFVACELSNLKDAKNNVKENKSNNENAYKVYEKEYTAYNKEDKPFIVKYAQISGLDNKSLESQINQTLKSSITEWINKDCEWMAESQMNVEYKTSKLLSLCYTIEMNDDRGKDFASTYARIGITVDLNKGVRVYLNDLFKDTSSLKQELVGYSYGNEISPPISSKEADEIIHYASISEKKYFEEIYKNDPLVYDFMFTYIRAKPSFYLTDTQIVITRDENKYNDVFINFEQ